MKTQTIRLKDLNRLACFIEDLEFNEFGKIYFYDSGYGMLDGEARKEAFEKIKNFTFNISPRNNDYYLIKDLQISLKKYVSDLKEVLRIEFETSTRLEEDDFQGYSYEDIKKWKDIRIKNMIKNDSFLNIKYRNILKRIYKEGEQWEKNIK